MVYSTTNYRLTCQTISIGEQIVLEPSFSSFARCINIIGKSGATIDRSSICMIEISNLIKTILEITKTAYQKTK
jgi:hypothetical protein